MEQTKTTPSILRRPAVEARTGLARSTIYAQMKAGAFPNAIRLGAKSVGWVASEIDAWIAAQIDLSRKA